MVTLSPDIGLNEYLRVIKRRKYQFLLPFALTILLAIMLAFLLPPRYRSEATLLIERQTIPTGLVETTVTGYVQERIQQITQKLLTYDNLSELARKYDLYSDLMAANQGEAVRKVREDFSIEMVDVKASDPDQAGVRQATIAFTVAFYADTPATARAIAAELADRYLEENEKQRLEQAVRVSTFFEDESRKLSAEIGDLEAKIANFKKQELNNLPEVAQLNRTIYDRTESDVEGSRNRVRDLESRLDSLHAELAVTPAFNDVRSEEGGVILNNQDRMNALVAQYVRATAKYSSKHPDVQRLSREIRALAEQTGNSGRADELMNELIRQQEALRQAQQKYGPDHPDVQQLQKSVSALETGFQRALVSSDGNSRAAEPNNPAYVALQSQMSAARSSLAGELDRLKRLEAKLADYEARLIASPFVESEYQTLMREHQNKVGKYNELKAKELQARLAQELESTDGGERFSLSSPALLPNTPESPNRLGILLLGILVAGVLGVAVVAITEFMDNAVYDVHTVTSIFGAPPLAVIPRITQHP